MLGTADAPPWLVEVLQHDYLHTYIHTYIHVRYRGQGQGTLEMEPKSKLLLACIDRNYARGWKLIAYGEFFLGAEKSAGVLCACM